MHKRRYCEVYANRALCLALLSLILFGCSKEKEQIYLKKIIAKLEHPVFLTAPDHDAERLFILERPGRIRIYRNKIVQSRPFLDLTSKVRWNAGEMGLLGLAFHPQYGENGFFYVAYTDQQRRTLIERYKVSNDRDIADPASAKLILQTKRHSRHHHAGMLQFGNDRKLFIGIGDGSVSGDPENLAQNRGTLFGSLLRIDVDGREPYSIPSDNPYYGHREWKGEIWASGLRNPWRFSFDRTENRLYIGDTGEKLWEEINVIPASAGGRNFGWRIMEGNHCFTKAVKHLRVERYKPAETCETEGFELPATEYSHSEGCAVIGGFVYRGNEIASIQGHYFYADYCLGWIRSFRYDGKQAVDKKQWDFGVAGNVLSFGEDGEKNLYVLYESGDVYRFAKK